MDLALVECFLRVAELGSINRAAEEMGMTQPALSRRVAALERDMGVALLVRGARGIALTEAGVKLTQGAGRISSPSTLPPSRSCTRAYRCRSPCWARAPC